MTRNATGFTLVEMLVTIALMGLMAVICWRGLDYVAGQRAEVERETGELARIVRTFAQLERDLAERLPDTALPPRAPAGQLPLALALAAADGNVQLEIQRFAAQPDGAPRALRVLYRLNETGLVRSTRPLEETRAAGAEVLLLPGAFALQVRVYAGGFWVQPGTSSAVQPPVRATAIEFALNDGKGARYVKVLPL
jgi:type II secretion system protein J